MNPDGKLAATIATNAGFKVVLTEDVKDAYESLNYTLRIMQHDDGRRLVIETSLDDFRFRQARTYARHLWKSSRQEAGTLGTLKEMLGV